jgi:hypothetical protein
MITVPGTEKVKYFLMSRTTGTLFKQICLIYSYSLQLIPFDPKYGIPKHHNSIKNERKSS